MKAYRFTQSWADALRARINTSQYQELGKRWVGAVALRRSDFDEAGVLLELESGVCTAATCFNGAAAEGARAAIVASEAQWDGVVAGAVDPMLGLARGYLKLERGSMKDLLPHLPGARLIVQLAREADLSEATQG